MPWTEHYFESQYLIMVIGASVAGLIAIVYIGATVFKKLSTLVSKRVYERQKRDSGYDDLPD